MMSKINTYLISVVNLLILLTLSTCHTTQIIRVQTPLPELTVLQPTTEIPLPVVDFQFLNLAAELEKWETPRKDISETFTDKERQDIAVSDPKLLAEENTMIVDLTLIPNQEYTFPLPGAKVISPYGGRRRHHSGVDLKTRANDTILAAFDGIVRLAKPYAAYGKVIVVRHYNGLETVYSHNSKNLVKPGDMVKAGQPIALTGRTGRATTEHLHFELRVNGQHFNPAILFNMESGQLQNKCLIFTKKGSNIAVKSVDSFQRPDSNLSYIPYRNIQ